MPRFDLHTARKTTPALPDPDGESAGRNVPSALSKRMTAASPRPADETAENSRSGARARSRAISRAELMHSESSNPSLSPRPTEDVRCSPAKERTVHSVLSLYRHQSFEPDDLELLSHLVPDLQIALRVQQYLGELRARAERAERALDAVPVAVLVLDAHGNIAHANQPATALLQRLDGLRSIEGRLCCEHQTDTDRLHGAIERVAQGVLRGDPPGGITLAVYRSNRSHPLGVLIAALPRQVTTGASGQEETAAGGAHVLVTVRDPDDAPRLPVAALQQQFDLTPAQARLAAALAASESLEDYAHRTGVSVNTARTTLKSVFAKTGCRRQAELVLVLTGSVAALPMLATEPPDTARNA